MLMTLLMQPAVFRCSLCDQIQPVVPRLNLLCRDVSCAKVAYLILAVLHSPHSTVCCTLIITACRGTMYLLLIIFIWPIDYHGSSHAAGTTVDSEVNRPC